MCNNLPFHLRFTDFHPGEFIADSMEALGYTQKELAKRLSTTEKKVSQLINHKIRITEEYASRLETVLGYNAKFWLDLEIKWQEGQKRAEQNKKLLKHKDWIVKFRCRELEKLGVIQTFGRSETAERIRQLLTLFRFATPEQVEADVQRLSVAYRRRETKTGNVEARYVWVSIGRRIVERTMHPATTYTPKRLQIQMQKLRSLLQQAWTAKELKAYFAEAGVLLIFVPPLKGISIAGASYWHCGMPVIQMRCQYDDDRFWFNLVHEVDHILHDGRDLIAIDGDQIECEDPREKRANDNAANFLLPPNADLSNIIHTPEALRRIADEYQLPVGTIVGRLQHQQVIQYNQYNSLKCKLVFEPDTSIFIRR